MPMQLSDADFIKLSSIIHRAGNELARAHIAFAGYKMQPEHKSSAYRVRDYMGMLLADFEDGPFYGALQGDCSGMLCSMRLLEKEATELIDAMGTQDRICSAMNTESGVEHAST